MSTKKAKNPKNDRAAAIAEKIAEQIKTLITRDWPEISAKLDEDQGGDGEITLAFKTLIRDRSSAPGEESTKDNQIKSVLSFSTRFSDTIESAIPDPAQMSLDEQNQGEQPPSE